jgi:dethiobiotin synthetase
MRLAGYFVTGTDTGVGKTTLTCAWAAALTRRRRRVLAAKPVESGGGDDALRLARAAGHPPACWRSFSAPIAPGVAAELAGEPIDLGQLEMALLQAAADRDAELVLVEGAGGLLCPLGARATIADFARRLELPLIVVARSGLGTINHSVLTVREARRQGLSVAGVVLSEVAPERTPDEATDAQWVERLGEVRVLGHLRHADGEPPPALLDLSP